jgi:hypothetical protein
VTGILRESELRDLVVKQLGAMDDVDFDRARAMATRHRIPLERAIVERSGDQPPSGPCCETGPTRSPSARRPSRAA